MFDAGDEIIMERRNGNRRKHSGKVVLIEPIELFISKKVNSIMSGKPME